MELKKSNNPSKFRGFHAGHIVVDMPIVKGNFFLSVDVPNPKDKGFYVAQLSRVSNGNQEILLEKITKDEDSFFRDVEDIKRLFDIQDILKS